MLGIGKERFRVGTLLRIVSSLQLLVLNSLSDPELMLSEEMSHKMWGGIGECENICLL